MMVDNFNAFQFEILEMYIMFYTSRTKGLRMVSTVRVEKRFLLYNRFLIFFRFFTCYLICNRIYVILKVVTPQRDASVK